MPTEGTSLFGSKLRAHRTGQRMSLQVLANLVHYSKGHLSKVENGEKPASAQLARGCDEVLGAGGELLLAYRAGLGAPRAQPQRPAQLPMATAPFIGRTAQLAALDTAFDRLRTKGSEAAAIIVVDGMAGVGKSALMLQWAHRVAERFSGGGLFYDLCPGGVPADSGQVLAGFLQALGVRTEEIPRGTAERAALYRTLLAKRRVLVVLDNAVSAERVRPLLPSAPGSLVLVGSRDRLPGLVARNGAARVTLQPLSTDESCELLRQVTGQRQPGVSPVTVAEVVGRCGHLPLALRIAAENILAGDQGIAFAGDDAGLDLLSAGNDEGASIRAAFEQSFRTLDNEFAHAFRLLGRHAATGVSLAAAAVLLDTDEATAWRRLDALYQLHLVEQPSQGRYRVHCLLRAYAAELATADQQQCDAGSRRLLEWYGRTAQEALRTLLSVERDEALARSGNFPTLEHAWQWCQAEELNLHFAIAHAGRLNMDALSVELSDVAEILSLLRYGSCRAAEPLGRARLGSGKEPVGTC
ncbi:helix-turn-helix domain-containing protein [Streptomyces sp. HUAS TT20]|uniref:helix-turn-helix domain-containing protein n=1 Tax=Streptomyces sp. HUAS TT20 TaxID=3447509 RepID=UPI0021D90CC0|nr:helix-turn-helix domain-containing protein [Streptomyces sp. HUAS 15-9]UXY33124.1 NB-ARC domain-containing protein [Streptomyces sp. HUAS 15-9]